MSRDGTGTLAVAEHIGAHRTVRHVRPDIYCARQLFERVEIFGEAFPLPCHPFGQCGSGNVLDPFHQADQPFVLVGAGRGEADAAIAHHDGGDT